MYEVKQLYVLWASDEGDKKLIPKSTYDYFLSNLAKAEKEFESYVMDTPFEDQDDDRVYELRQNVYDLIDEQETLEGELVYVVKPEDIKGDLE